MVTRSSVLSIVVLAATTMLASQACADTATIGFTTYLRDGPSVRYRAIDEALSDQQVDVLSCANGWCHIAYSDATGYVAQGALVAASAAQSTTVSNPQSCFVSRIAGYHGGPDVTFCTPASR